MELVEGEEKVDHGIIFKRVGPELRVVEEGFSCIPCQALAISNKFGLIFFVHSEGFHVARTRDLVQASQSLVDSKREYNAKDNSLASFHLPLVQSLALSHDELILAACTNDTVQFYNVAALVQKGKEDSQIDTAPLNSLSFFDEKPGIKVLSWNPVEKNTILLLSKAGKMLIGPFAEQELKEVAHEVEAADWSPDGDYMCYITTDKNIHVCKADLSVRSCCEFPGEMFSGAINSGSEAVVDVLKWARFDSILVSCVHNGSDGEEDDSRIFVLVSSQGNFTKLQDQTKAKVFSFEGFFTTIDTSILPPDSGPYTLSYYVPPWELLIVTSRRSVDDHISLLGWSQEDDRSEIRKFELLDDRYTPRIELQACGDDNCVVGLAVDTTTTLIQIPAPNGDSGEKLRPGPVLFCMTVEGNLILFSLARIDSKESDIKVISKISELPEANKVLESHGLIGRNKGEKSNGIEDFDKNSVRGETLTQETNNEQSKDTVTQELSTEQMPIPPSAAVPVGTSAKLEAVERMMHLSNEGVQGRLGSLSKEKEAPFGIGMTEQTGSAHVVDRKMQPNNEGVLGWSASLSKEKETPFGIGMTEQTSSAQLVDRKMEPNNEGVLGRPGVLSKENEGPLGIGMTEQTSSAQLVERKTQLNNEGVQGWPGFVSKEKEAPLGIEMTDQKSSAQLQSTTFAPGREGAISQKQGNLEKRKDISKEGLQAGAEPLKHKEPPPSSVLRNKPTFSTELKGTSAPALSEMESEFNRELDEVKDMATQIDNLMALIEGRKKERGGEAKPFFTKLLVEDIESNTRNLFRQCQSFRERLREEGRNINDLGDESLQVDYGRVYVQSILEQAFDVRYQELWNKQTLHPEVAALRKRILKADQSLKLQIGELEDHLHNLELSHWQKKHQSKHSTGPSSRLEDKNFRIMQSLYDTVNAQLIITQQLADRLTLQMEVLKLPAIPSEDVESSMDISRLKLQGLVLQDQFASDLTSRKGSHLNSLRPSGFSPVRRTSNSQLLQTPMKSTMAAGTRTSLQDSTRRRRDSVDKLWVDVGSAKTTVKRAPPPARRLDETSFPSNKELLEADNNQLKYRSYSSAGPNSGSGARKVMATTSFHPMLLAERPKQTRTDTLELYSSSQGNTQVPAPASASNSVSWPSKAVTSSAHTASFSAPLQDTSFPRVSLNKPGVHNRATTNAERLQGFPSHAPLMAQTFPQDHPEHQSGTISLGHASQIGPLRMESTAKSSSQLATAKPVEAFARVGKIYPSQKASFPLLSQGKGATAASSLFPAQSSSDLQQKTALNVLQSKQQQGALKESEDLNVGKSVLQASSCAPVDIKSHRSVPLIAKVLCGEENITDQQGQAIIGTFKQEPADIIEKANTSAAFEALSEQKSSSPSTVVPNLSPGGHTIMTLSKPQAHDDFNFTRTNSASASAGEHAQQPLPSLSFMTASSSPSTFQSPKVMATMSTMQEIIPAADVASCLPAEASSLFNVSTVSSPKSSVFLDKGVMPAEQASSLSTVSVSTSLVPSTLQEPPPVSDEEDMEEVGTNINDFPSSSFAGFGLGSSSSSAGSQHSSPFGGSSIWNQANPPTSLSVPAGQLFKPASFSIPTPQSTVQTTSTLFGNNATSGTGGPFASANSGFGSLAQPTATFGQPAQSGSSGQQALGSALGTFGQTRQIGSPFGVASPSSGFGASASGGFASAATGGGFANVAPSGGFAGVGAGGGFAGITSGGGFAGVGAGGGFAGAAASGGFANAPAGVGFGSFSGGSNAGGFGAFSGGFGGNTNSSIFTQMRK